MHSARPATAATANAAGAVRTERGVATPVAVSRIGPRRFASVPRTPSE